MPFRSLFLILVLLAPALGATQETKLLPDDGAPNDFFGHGVALSADGTTALVSARTDDPGLDAGAVYVFVRDGDAWVQEARLQASDAEADDLFGEVAIALSGDGDLALIGATGDDDGGSRSGAVYVYTRSGDTWAEQTKLTASDAEAGDRFGTDVALNADATTALIAALGAEASTVGAGAVYVFARSGDTWTEQTTLPFGGVAPGDGYSFGNAVALSASGATALVSARRLAASGALIGQAHVFTGAGDTWAEEAVLAPATDAPTVPPPIALSGSGDLALLGAQNAADTGRAFVFSRTGGVWTEGDPLVAPDADGSDSFGFSVALSADDARAFVGAPGDDETAPGAGAAYLFVRAGAGWALEGKLRASDGTENDLLGRAVSLSGDGAVRLVGAAFADDAGDSSGSAYVFEGTDLVLTKSVSPAAVAPGEAFTFTVRIANDGPTAASDIIVADAPPSGLDCGAPVPSEGAYASGTWTLGALADGEAATLETTCSAAAGGSYTNTATLTASDPFDPEAANNEAQATVTVAAAGTHADLVVTKRADRAEVFIGDAVTFVVTLSNRGPEDAGDITVADPQPVGLQFDAVTPSVGTYDTGTGVWSVPSLANGASATLEVVASATAVGELANVAALTGSDPRDPVPTNNRGRVEVFGVARTTVACTPAAPLTFDDYDADPADGRGDSEAGEFALLRTLSRTDPNVDLAGCAFVVLDPFTEAVTYATDATGTAPAGVDYLFANTVDGLGQPIPEGALPDGPGAFALVQGSASVGQDVGEVVASTDIVAAVVYLDDAEIVGKIGGDRPGSADASVEFLEALARLRSVSTDAAPEADLAVVAAPNPVSTSGTVSFGLAEAGDATVALYDVRGREVAVLASGPRGAGRHTVSIPAASFPPGVYAVRVAAGAAVQTAWLVIAR